MTKLVLSPLAINDLLALEYPENTVIANDILDVGGLMLVVGPTSVGKSYFLLQLAMHLVTGTAVVGQWAVPRAFSTYLVQAEIGRKRFQSRVGKLWANFDGTAAAELWLESPYDLKLDTPEGLAALEAVVVEKGVEVLIIDPLRPFHGRNENDSQEMQLLFDSFLRLQFKYDVAVVFGHHDRKPAADGWGKSIYKTRGNTVITDRPDTSFRIEESKQAGMVEFVNDKLRNGEQKLPKQRWRADRKTGLFSPLDTQVVDKAQIVTTLLALGELPLSEVVRAVMVEGGVSNKGAYSIINALEKAGVVVKTIGGRVHNEKGLVLVGNK